MNSHTLMVGATGMLAGFSAEMAAGEGALTSIARTQRSLAALDTRVPEPGRSHRLLALDCDDFPPFEKSLERSVFLAGATFSAAFFSSRAP